ncbi:hypothetical protein [Candidatus Aeolococcus gillhamiae]
MASRTAAPARYRAAVASKATWTPASPTSKPATAGPAIDATT